MSFLLRCLAVSVILNQACHQIVYGGLYSPQLPRYDIDSDSFSTLHLTYFGALSRSAVPSLSHFDWCHRLSPITSF